MIFAQRLRNQALEPQDPAEAKLQAEVEGYKKVGRRSDAGRLCDGPADAQFSHRPGRLQRRRTRRRSFLKARALFPSRSPPIGNRPSCATVHFTRPLHAHLQPRPVALLWMIIP